MTGTNLLDGVAFVVAAGLALGASFVLVRRLEALAGRWHLSEAMLGLVVALAADSPEITSAVSASIQHQRVIGAGVVLGSNVFNLAALLGLGAVVAGRITLHQRVVVLEGITACWVAAATVVTLSTGIGAGLGLCLVLVAVVPYMVVSAVPVPRLRALGLSPRVMRWLGAAVEEERIELAPAIHTYAAQRFDLLAAAACLVGVVGASTVMEHSAQSLGHHLGLSDLVIGGVILAALTSLPNAVGAVVLASRGRGTAVLSEAMNSNMLNVVVGLFIPALFAGFGSSGNVGAGLLVAAFYAGLTVASLALAFFGRGLVRWSGGAIVVGYLVFVVVATAR